MSSENESWGYTRIVGELSKLGHRGVALDGPPDPEGVRDRARTGAATAYAVVEVPEGALGGACGGRLTVEVWTRIGLVRYLVFFVIDLPTRRVEIAGIAPVPNGLWMHQVARNLIDDVSGFLRGKGFLIHDRDPLYTRAFRQLLSHAGVTSVRLPPRSESERVRGAIRALDQV